MPNHTSYANNLITEQDKPDQKLPKAIRRQNFESDPALPLTITKAASKQTYYTIRFLVDRDRTLNAYRAYAYFRWVDDSLDQSITTNAERIIFLQRQQQLISGYQDACLCDLCAEERILMDLLQSDQTPHSGLQTYIHKMISVMAFDADRRGRLISQQELNQYSENLATAVTEALHYFIGHDDFSPQLPTRYLAVTGAHITHMLRDTYEDIDYGYFNIACEFLDAHGIGPCDVAYDAFKEWVESRVQLARNCFETGKQYLKQVENRRCRIAGYAYTARFEAVLDAIEKAGYQVRPDYLKHNSLRSGLKMSWSMLSMLLNDFIGAKS